MAELQHRLPVNDADLSTRLAVQVNVLPATGMITLRGELGSPQLQDAVREVAGCAIPPPLRFSETDGCRVCWMSPDELLLQVPFDSVTGRLDSLRTKLAGSHHLAVDVSDARVRFQLFGDGSRDVVAKGAPIDLHHSKFQVGTFRRTRLGSVAVAICQTAATPEAFEILCFRSYANFMLTWLRMAAREGTLLE